MLVRQVMVAPTQEILKAPAGSFLRGGPLWPRWPLQVGARHCRGLLPRRWDDRPHDPGPPLSTHAEGVWCGPVCYHFGHAIADFGMRVAASAETFPGTVPLVFSFFEAPAFPVPDWFWDILRHLGVPRERVLIVDRPALFERLHVLPQAERLGRGPSAAHLDRMDRLTGDAARALKDIGLLYVSRSGQTTGRIAGEAYLDVALTAAGARVFHPESAPLAEQIGLYARARAIVFAEGSAVHTLQLMGRLGADVAVLVRRPGSRLAAASLRPRARRLRYVDAVQGLVYGRRRSGQPYHARGLTLLAEDRLIAGVRGLGLDLAPVWDGAAFRAAREADVAAWWALTRSLNLHPRAMETAAGCLRRAGLPIPPG